ncbi:MAG: S46 family peptidase, partial [Bacteroidales bacterium]|nr:S46 family peptidase [Bacteroidales bacterium]
INQASLKDAVGALDRGSCTAELISADGLLVTNHHCGYDEIQYHSSVEHDYLKNGFWAMTREEELPNEGKTITFLVRMEEVTDQIVPKLNEEMGVRERNAKIRSLSGAITSEALSGTHYDGRIRSMFNDNRFFLFVTETYRDVRLVGAPPESIGRYGGDTDNWMWPRHTGDFSLFRVYTAPDGKPADYSPENIPLKPDHFLPISLNGYKKNDFTMVMGFPGRTSRYMTSWETNELLDITNPSRIKIRGVKQKLMMEDMQADDKVRIQYSSKHSHSANYWKYAIGQSKGLINLDVMIKKQKQEEAFRQWVNQSAERRAMYGNALKDIQEAVEGRREYQNAARYLEETILRASFDEGGMESVSFARNLRELERVMADPEPDQEEIKAVASELKEFSESFYKDYNPPTDKKVMVAMIRLLIEDLEDQYQPSNIDKVKTKYKGDVEKYVDRYFKKSFVVDQERFNAFMDNPSLKVLRKDPAYQAALATSVYFEIRGRMAEFEASYDRGSRLYLKGLVEMYPEKDFYSDANSTMRMNYGTVGDYIARDAVLFT